jgi:flagellar hook-associated protein 2
MMKIEQLKLDRKNAAQTVLKWKQEAYTNVSSALRDFKYNFLSVTGADSLTKESAYNAYTASVTGSGANAVTLSPSVYASVGNLAISSVDQLAKGASAASLEKVSSDPNGLTAATKLKELNLKTDLSFDGSGNISFSINGESFTFNEDDTLGKMINTVNASNAGVTMGYSQITDKFTVETKTKGVGQTLTIVNKTGNAFSDNGAFGMVNVAPVVSGAVKDKNGGFLSSSDFGTKLGAFLPAGGNNSLFAIGKDELSFEINGETFTFDKTDTLTDVINTVNSSGAGVNITFDDATHKFSLTPTGYDGKLEIKNKSGNIFGASSALEIDSPSQRSSYSGGQNALLTINGVQVERDSNSFTLDGIDFTLNRTTAAGEEIFATIKKDASAVIDNVKKFVEGYNTLVKKLTELTTTRKSTSEKDYLPLTDEEKSAMTEEQIEAYEAIAKKGVIYGDAGIRRLLTNMRSALYETVQGTGLSPSSIGIKMGGYFDESKDQIALDEDKLRAAIESDPEKVMAVLAGTDSSGGFLTRISSLIDTYNIGSGASNLDALTDRLKSASEDIEAFKEKMTALEEKYYLKFAAMETALSKMNEQTSWLESLMGQSSS